jgi:hypothetical protein
MPIRHTIWTIDSQPTALPIQRLAREQQLEDMIVAQPAILSNEWMLIGQQESTGFGGRIDLLAIAPDASLVLVELKRDRSPREVVAQALDYAAWVENLTSEQISDIYQRFVCRHTGLPNSLNEAFRTRFGDDIPEDELNASHQIVIVASELDSGSERIINYLNDKGIPVNALFFQVFAHAGSQLLSRAWLIDPGSTQINAAVSASNKGEKEPWNGEFYVSYGGNRSWSDAERFGYISAGGGAWYSRTLDQLEPGNLVWVKIPGKGFVGVGIVEEPAQQASDIVFSTSEGEKGFFDVISNGEYFRSVSNDPDKGERVVRIHWLQTLPEAQAINETGFFGNQNSVCKPATPKWRHTVERLKRHFTDWNSHLDGADVSVTYGSR